MVTLAVRMIKTFGYFSLFVFLVLCSQVSGFSSGFGIWFLSIFSVISGTLALGLLQFPKELEPGAVTRLLQYGNYDHRKLIETLKDLSEIIRKDGLLAVEGARREIKDPFLRFILKKIVGGFDKVQVNSQIRNRFLRVQELFMIAQTFFDRILNAIPIVGLIASLFQIMAFLNSNTGSVGVTLIPFVFSLLLQVLVQAFCSESMYRAIDAARLYYILIEDGIHGIQDGLGGEVLSDRLHARFDENMKWID